MNSLCGERETQHAAAEKGTKRGSLIEWPMADRYPPMITLWFPVDMSPVAVQVAVGKARMKISIRLYGMRYLTFSYR